MGTDSSETIKKNLIYYTDSQKKSLTSALRSIAEEMLQDSKSNYVPFDSTSQEEHLRDTGKVLEPEVSPDSVSVKVQYGGTPHTAPYAISVHETPSRYDPPSWVGSSVAFKIGGHKYLELPFKQSLSNLLPKLAEKMRS